MKYSIHNGILLASVVTFLALFPLFAHAADRYWSGSNSTTFSDGANWTGGVAPTNLAIGGDVAYFTAASFTNQPTITADQSITGLVFGDGVNASGAVTISNLAVFAIGPSGLLMNSNAGAVTFTAGSSGLRFRIAADQTWTNNSSNAFTLASTTSYGNATGTNVTLTFAGSGAFNMAGSVNNNPGGGALSLIVATTGTGTVGLAQSGSTGGVTLDSGRLELRANNALGFGTFTINGGTLQVNTIRTNTTASAIVINGNFTYGSSAQANRIYNTGTATVTLGANVAIDTFGGDLQLGGVVGDGGNGRGITKTGAGTLTLAGANTYSGNTANSAGILILSNGLALQNSALDTANSVAGSASAGLRATTSALTLGGLVGDKNLADVFTTTSGGYGSITALTLNPGTGRNNSYAGAIADGAAGLALTQTGAGTQVLSGSNSYTGATTVSAGTLLATRAVSLAGYTNAAKVVVSGGTLAVQVGGAGWTTGQVDTMLSNATKTSGQLGIDTSNGNLNQWTALVGGGNMGSLGLTKLGANTLTLNNSNSYTGNTVITDGVLNLNSSTGSALGASTNITVAAMLLISQSNQISDTATVTLSGGTIQRGSGVSEVFGNLDVSSASFLNFGTGDVGTLSFGTYTPSALLTVQNFFEGNVLTFGSNLSDSINNTNSFQFDNAFTSSWNEGASTFTITAIPEPSTYLAAAGLLAVLLWPSRRRLLKDAKSVLGLHEPMRSCLAARKA
jgi:fibronectin-binding autotransporter adhesin